jgi:hypothetical protein
MKSYPADFVPLAVADVVVLNKGLDWQTRLGSAAIFKYYSAHWVLH